jgi:hypothetical protein
VARQRYSRARRGRGTLDGLANRHRSNRPRRPDRQHWPAFLAATRTSMLGSRQPSARRQPFPPCWDPEPWRSKRVSKQRTENILRSGTALGATTDADG